MKKFTFSAALVGLSLLAACGKPVSVEPGYVGKLNTEAGLQETLIPPSKFRLETFCVNCDNLILLEASDQQVKETMNVFMPKDQLNLALDIRGVLSIASDEATVNPVFNRVPAASTEDGRIFRIDFNKVYQIYGQQVLRETPRSVLVKYSIGQIMENRDSINAELETEIKKRLQGTPITVKRIGMADVQFPDVIIKAKEIAAQRDAEIAQVAAEAAIALERQKIDLIEAETQVKVDKKLAEGVSQAFVTQRWLKTMETLAANDAKTVIILPADAIGDPSMMMPLMNRALRN